MSSPWDQNDKSRWKRGDKIALLSLIVALLGTLLSLVVPETRCFLHLECTSSSTLLVHTSSSSSASSTPIPIFSTPTPTSTLSTSAPTPTSDIPHLAQSYTGSLTRLGNATFTLVISDITEDSQGNFTANGRIDTCSILFEGTIKPDGAISFTAQGLSARCENLLGLPNTFTGQLSDGQLGGKWQGSGASNSGDWMAS